MNIRDSKFNLFDTNSKLTGTKQRFYLVRNLHSCTYLHNYLSACQKHSQYHIIACLKSQLSTKVQKVCCFTVV